MMAHRRRGVAITAKLLIDGNLLGAQQHLRFEMRRQMHVAKTTLQLRNPGGLHGQPLWCDLGVLEELIEDAFTLDQLSTERPGGSAHPVEDRLNAFSLSLGQPEWAGEVENVLGSG